MSKAAPDLEIEKGFDRQHGGNNLAMFSEHHLSQKSHLVWSFELVDS
jgi:hypothetical protein